MLSARIRTERSALTTESQRCINIVYGNCITINYRKQNEHIHYEAAAMHRCGCTNITDERRDGGF